MYKDVSLPDIGEVRLYKRRGTRSIRLSVGAGGRVQVTMPPWAPYRLGMEFALAKADWIAKHLVAPIPLEHDDIIGKHHRLQIVTDVDRKIVATRVTDSKVQVYIPVNEPITSEFVQKKARQAAIRALKQQAAELLPPRLADLAARHGFTYRSVRIKQLKGRWGSCNQYGDITLNSYLMQLPWELIDYVLLHELQHTRILAHGPAFWQALEQHVPNLNLLRKNVRQYQPALQIVRT